MDKDLSMQAKLTIKSKLVITLCVPLLLMTVFFIYSLINTEKRVLAKEKSNVQIQLATVLDEKLKGQVNTITYAISDFYEHSKLEYIKEGLIKEMSDFDTGVNI